MSELGSFSELASVKGNQVEKPKPLPEGNYSVMITGPYKEHKAKSGNSAMRFPAKVIAPLDDVDQAALAAAGPKALEREFAIDFWMSPDARWRFTEFAVAMGIDPELNLLEMGSELATLGTPFQMTCKQEPAQNDPSTVYARFDNPVPLS